MHVNSLTNIFFQRGLQLIQIPKGLLCRDYGIHVMGEQRHIIAYFVGPLLAIRNVEIMSECPGFIIENRAFLLFVVIRRLGIHFEQHRQRYEPILS